MTAAIGQGHEHSGHIEQLFLMARHGSATAVIDDNRALACVAGLGITGDVHANRLSPRQILITLRSQLDALGIAPGALRENMVIALDSPAHFVPGARIVSSGGVEIWLTMYCEPCARIQALGHGLRTLIHRRGILGRIVASGALRAGDGLRIEPGCYRPLPESAYQRFLDFMRSVPAGHVVRYKDVVIGMGAADSFVRALPAYIKRSAGEDIARHRIVNARGQLLPFVRRQVEMLAAEGVQFEQGSDSAEQDKSAVDLRRYLWNGERRPLAPVMNLQDQLNACDSRIRPPKSARPA
ncbi:MAG: MGMT family protein [Massilia sp.]